MDLELNDRIAVVTGASKGIGLAVTRTLLDEGAYVVAASRFRSPELDELDDGSGHLLHEPVDLMHTDAPAQVVARAVTEFGGVDVLVNNAGGPPPGITLPRASFFDASDVDWRAMLEFNLLSAVRACRAALPIMLERGDGSIVNVASVNGRVPYQGNVDYSASKAALLNLSKVLSEEFAPQGVRVNTVSPGPVVTPWWTDPGGAADVFAAQAGVSKSDVLEKVAPAAMNISTGRLATPQEIADAIVLLASPRSASTTGAEFVVDGGMSKSL